MPSYQLTIPALIDIEVHAASDATAEEAAQSVLDAIHESLEYFGENIEEVEGADILGYSVSTPGSDALDWAVQVSLGLHDFCEREGVNPRDLDLAVGKYLLKAEITEEAS